MDATVFRAVSAMTMVRTATISLTVTTVAAVEADIVDMMGRRGTAAMMMVRNCRHKQHYQCRHAHQYFGNHLFHILNPDKDTTFYDTF